MSPLALLLLRRATVYALVLAILLATVPRLLTWFGVMGPSLEEEIAGVERSLQAARSYGASASEPGYARAEKALGVARELAGRGERWGAKRAIEQARQAALDSQKAALATRDEARRMAQKAVSEIDRTLNELEDLYAEVAKLVEKQEAERLFSLMKTTRQRSATLFLFFEEQGYDKVIAGEPDVRALLASTRAELMAARGRRAAPAPRP